MKKLFQQIVRFGLVGVMAFCIDYGLMLLLTEGFHIHYMISAAISFTVSAVFNYLMSVAFVFQTDSSRSRLAEFILFFAMSAVGLGINQGMMWLLSEQLPVPYQLSKIFATGVVMVYNFVTRKLFLEKR